MNSQRTKCLTAIVKCPQPSGLPLPLPLPLESKLLLEVEQGLAFAFNKVSASLVVVCTIDYLNRDWI